MSTDASDYYGTNGSDVMSDGYSGSGAGGFVSGTSASSYGSFSDWADLLKTGIGHYASYEAMKLRYSQPVAPQPTYVAGGQPSLAQQQANQNLLKWGLIAAAVFLVVSSLPKTKG